MRCVYCGSEKVISNGSRRGKFCVVRRLLCKGCGRAFTVGGIGQGKKFSPDIINEALRVRREEGMSLGEVAEYVKRTFGRETHPSTILYWEKKHKKSAPTNTYIPIYIPTHLPAFWESNPRLSCECEESDAAGCGKLLFIYLFQSHNGLIQA